MVLVRAAVRVTHRPTTNSTRGERKKPGNLPTLRGFKHAEDSGFAPGATLALATARHNRAGFVTVQASQPVVAKREFNNGVVLRATNVGAFVGRPQLNGSNVPGNRRNHRRTRS